MKFVKSTSNSWKNIAGNVYGMLTVLGYVGKGNWECLCSCGNKVVIETAKITTKHKKSCGCLKGKSAIKHGKSHTPEYHSWSNLKARCSNPKFIGYHNYGGRGIKVCEWWLNSFDNFYADMGPRPGKKYSIDRIDNDGNYEPGNCRWATVKQQADNRRSNILIDCKGTLIPLKQACENLGLEYKTIFARIKILGWTTEKAFSTKQ
jgi:hypothetical protein